MAEHFASRSCGRIHPPNIESSYGLILLIDQDELLSNEQMQNHVG